MSNTHRISIVHIITSIIIHLHLPRRYLGTIRQCHVRLAASIPHPRLYSDFGVQAFPLCSAFAFVRRFVYRKHLV